MSRFEISSPVSDGNQLHGEERYLDSVADSINRLQVDGGVAPELAHEPASEYEPPLPDRFRRH